MSSKANVSNFSLIIKNSLLSALPSPHTHSTLLQGTTEVVVMEQMAPVRYVLDETLIDFGAALEEGDLGRAMATLQPLELTPEIAAQWRQLADSAIAAGHLAVAERCCAAVGNVARSRYLRNVSCLPGTDPMGR